MSVAKITAIAAFISVCSPSARAADTPVATLPVPISETVTLRSSGHTLSEQTKDLSIQLDGKVVAWTGRHRPGVAKLAVDEGEVGTDDSMPKGWVNPWTPPPRKMRDTLVADIIPD